MVRRPWSRPRQQALRRGHDRLRLSASTMCEAFQITAAEWADSPALRLKDTDYEASFGGVRGDGAQAGRRASRRSGSSRGDTVGFMLVNRPALHLTDCGRDAPRRHLLLRLQHLLAGADRVRRRRRREPGDRHRAGLPRAGAGGAGAGRDARARGRDRRRGAGGDDLDRGAGGDGRARTSTSRPPGARSSPRTCSA